MKKSVFFLLGLFVLNSTIFAYEIARNELESSKNTTIEFVNFTGPHKKIETAAAIRGIGSSLGKQVAEDTSKSFQSDKSAKYYVIHAIDEKNNSKLNADILVLNKDASVDHIKNLRRIVAGYIQSAYNYSASDADTLSVFITVYNAVYRGKIDNFKDKYNPVVSENLDSKYCGLSTNYVDWPGQTQIVIPLFDVNNGGLSTIDTSTISDSSVIKSMKDDDDKNIESRKELVDIKEREADEAYDKAQDAQKEAANDAKALEEEKKKTKEAEKEALEAEKEAENAKKDAENAKNEAEDAQKNADEAKKLAEENPEDEELQNLADDAQKEADEKKAQADEKQSQADELQQLSDEKQDDLEEQKKAEEAKKQELEDDKAEAAKQQQLADKKDSEAQAERKDIAKDQSALQQEAANNSKIKSGYTIVLSDEEKLLSKLVIFNESNGQIIKTSPVTVIRNRTVYKTTDKYIAIAGEESASANSDIKLVLIDLDSLEIFSESEQSVSPTSVLLAEGGNYYCVISDSSEGEKWVIGQYDENLNLLAKSEIEVSPSTPITLSGSSIVVTDVAGKLKLLDKNKLNVLTN